MPTRRPGDSPDPGRRRLMGGALAATTLMLPALLRARRGPHVVIVGGGFAGGACAHWLQRFLPEAVITVVERQATQVSGYFCNLVLAGLLPEAAIRHALVDQRRAQVRTLEAEVTGVDPGLRVLRLRDGRRLHYDRLVLAIGIRHRIDAIEGYGASALRSHPPAWPGTLADLRQVAARLEALPQGGVLALVPPPNPYRCPPGPYERATLFAHRLQARNPRAKVLILDPKDDFTKHALFAEAWANRYPGRVEWLGRAQGGTPQSLDLRTGHLRLVNGARLRVDWIHYLPPQRAAGLADRLGIAGVEGWVAVEAEQLRLPGEDAIHAIGDAVDLAPMPKSAFAANEQARRCAAAIAAAYGADIPPLGWLANTCYSHVGPGQAVSIGALYEAHDGRLAAIAGSHHITPTGVDRAHAAAESARAHQLYRHLRHICFNRPASAS